jgi:hypothetical protein
MSDPLGLMSEAFVKVEGQEPNAERMAMTVQTV